MKFSGVFNYVPPTKLVSDYSESEKARFQSAFQQTARDYRISRSVFLVIFVAIVAYFVFSKDPDWYLLVIGLSGIRIVLFCLFRPACPACKKNAAVSVRTYCPECGSEKIASGGFMRSKECLSCGEPLRNGKGGRRYKIRYCTHCGIFLDSKGI